MLVKQGWSGEVKPNVWAKVTVELDEGDLGRLLREHNVKVDPATIPVVAAYSLLEVEAELLILLKLMARHGYSKDEGVSEHAAFEQAKLSIIDELRTLEVPAEAYARS